MFNFALNGGHIGQNLHYFNLVNQTCECFILIVCIIRPLNIDKKSKEALAIRRVFSLVDMITNTKFSNCTLVFKISAVRQQHMQSKHQNTFQSISSLAKQ